MNYCLQFSNVREACVDGNIEMNHLNQSNAIFGSFKVTSVNTDGGAMDCI